MRRTDLRRDVDRDVEPVGLDQRAGAIGPFNENRGVLRSLFPAKFGQLGNGGYAIEICVYDGEEWKFVRLQHRVGGTRNVELRIAGKIAEYGPDERGLAGPEVAGQRDEVSGTNRRSEVHREMFRRIEVGKLDVPGRVLIARVRHRLGYSAACDPATAWIGKAQIATVPVPGWESMEMLPPCSDINDRTMARPRPAPRCCEPSA